MVDCTQCSTQAAHDERLTMDPEGFLMTMTFQTFLLTYVPRRRVIQVDNNLWVFVTRNGAIIASDREDGVFRPVVETVERCEHGLSASLCEGSQHWHDENNSVYVPRVGFVNTPPPF